MKLPAILTLFAACVLAQPAPDTIKVDNEFVRVLFLTDQPGTKTPLHRHPLNRVTIYLDPMQLILRYQDGEVERQNWRKGQVAWSPGGRLHTGENLMDRTARVVEVELKKPPSGKPFRTAHAIRAADSMTPVLNQQDGDKPSTWIWERGTLRRE